MPLPYVLITAARNEEAFIEKTLRAVIRQTQLPNKWIVVSDGSTDRTDDIVREYAGKHNFIELVQINDHGERTFRSKVGATKMGYARLEGVPYEFVGILDADVTFEPTYYERILSKFQENPKLGIAGGMVHELQNGKFERLHYNVNSVAGAVQLFRRSCFEDIGGHLPLEFGAEDAVAEVMSRMHGWQVQSFPEIIVFHHRRIGASSEHMLKARFRYGVRDYVIGNHPLFTGLKYISEFGEKPYVVGSILMMCGYLSSWIRREPRPVPAEVVKYLRSEQINRMCAPLPYLMRFLKLRCAQGSQGRL